MKGNPQGCYPLQDVLSFMSINVRRGDTTHDIALARADELRIGVLLLKEPSWSDHTKTHPNFDLHLPFGDNNIRPSAATYVRKAPKRLSSTQKFPSSLYRDYCWVEVNETIFLSLYQVPLDPSAVQLLLSWTPTPKSITIGDFNSAYWAWQPRANSIYRKGEEIEGLKKKSNFSDCRGADTSGWKHVRSRIHEYQRGFGMGCERIMYD